MKLTVRKLLLCSLFITATIAKSQVSSTGKLFYLSFMEMEARTGGYPDSLLLYVTSEVNTTITIDNPRIPATSYNVTITAGKVNRVSLDPGFYYPQGSEQPSTNIESKRSIRINAKDPVNVYCLNLELNRSDGTFCMPYESVPKAPEYFITAYSPNVNRGSSGSPKYMCSEFVIVAMDNNVQVEITPKARTKGGMLPGSSYTLTMPRGMVYQVQSTDTGGNTNGNISGATSNKGDLTGTRVRVINGCGKVNVFAGMKSTFVPWSSFAGTVHGACNSDGVDHIYTQVYPTTVLGKNYILTPFKSQSGYVYRILASKDTTDVYVNGSKVTATPLKAGQYYLEYVNTAATRCVTTTKPAYCVQYMLNAGCAKYNPNANDQGDPAILIMPDVSQRLLHTVVGTATTNNMNKHFVNILIPKGAKSAVLLNGTKVAAASFTDVPCMPYSYAQIQVVNPSTNTIDCDSGFIAVAYGIGQYESYSYCAGALFENLDYDFTISRNSKCPNVPVTLTAVTNNKNVKKFLWNFGDGFSDTGKTVVHSFRKVGSFYVTMKAVIPASCGGYDTVSRSQIINMAQGPLYNMPDTLFQCTNNLSITFTAPVNVKYLYKWQDSSIKNTYKATSPGKVWIRIRDTSTNCVLMDSTLVQQFNPIKAKISYDTAILCWHTNFFSLSDSTQFKSDSYKSAKWILKRFGYLDSISTLPRFRFKFDTTGSYSIQYQVLSKNGCRDTVTNPINVYHEPTAKIWTPKPEYCQKELATFVDSSTGEGGIGNSYWDFGDGSKSQGLKVTHNFGVYDTFKVDLITETVHKCRDTVDSMIIVHPLPVMAMTVTTNNWCKKANSFTFTDASTLGHGTMTNQWKYMNKTAGPLTTLSNIKFTDTGKWIVRLFNTTDKGCLDSIKKTIYVAPDPVAKITLLDSSLCFKGHFFDLDDGSTIGSGKIGTRKWSFSDGSSSTSKTVSNKTFSTYGTYNVKLVVSSATYNCKDSVNRNLVVLASPQAPFDINDSAQCVKGNSFDFTPINTFNVSGVTATYAWAFGDGNNSTNATPNHIYAAAGTYKVKFIISTSQSCADTAMRNVYVDPNPTAAFITSKDSACLGTYKFDFTNQSVFAGPLTNLWDLGDATKVTTTDVTQKNYGFPGTYTVKLVVTTSQNCKDSTTKKVVVMPIPKADFTINNSSQCLVGNSFVFNNTTNPNGATGMVYQWVFTPGATFNSQNIPNQTMADTGSYQVLLTAASGFGCKDQITKTIYVAETPTINITGGDACVGDDIQFNANASLNSGTISSYSWSFGDGNNASIQNPTHAYGGAGNYSVTCTVTSNKGCSATGGPLTVNAFARPKADFTAEQLMSRGIETDHKLTFTGSGATGYLWSFYDGSYDNTAGPVLKTFSDTGHKAVKLWVINNDGCTDSITKYIYLKPELQMWIVLSFTPNNDGLNETFGPSTTFGLSKYKMIIMDRWGEKMFDTRDPKVPWDGRDKNGANAPEGVYAYEISFRYIDGKIFVYRGTVTLMR